MQLVLLGMGMAFVFVTKAMLEPLVPLFALSLGASPTVVGILVAAPFLLPLFLAVYVGALVDRLPPSKLITVGAAALAIAPVGVVFFPNLLMLGAAQVAIGLAHLVLVISGQAYVASLASGKVQEANFGRYTTFLSAGQLIGPVLAGIFADALGYDLAFGLAGTISLVGVIISLFLAKAKRDRSAANFRFGDLNRVRELLSKGGIKAALTVSASVLFALGAYQAFFPIYLEGLNYPVTAIGVLLSLRAFAALSVRPFTATIISHFGGRFHTVIVMMALVSIGLLATGIGSSIVILGLAAVSIGIGWGITQPLSMVAVTEQVLGGERGFALSMRITANRLAQLGSPILFGLVAERSGVGATFVLSSAILILANLWIVRFGRHLEEGGQVFVQGD
jgi:MFS family permease